MLGRSMNVCMLVNHEIVVCACCTSDLLSLPAQEEKGMWLSVLVSGVSFECGCCWRQRLVCVTGRVCDLRVCVCICVSVSLRYIFSFASGQTRKQESGS